jgi:glycosyltransferase involved in cell wall biosynthesis
VVAGSFDRDEPVAAALAAAALLPDVELRFTGDPAKLPASAWSGAPRNALFTGYLPYREFLGELMAADVVAVFTTEEHAMNRAAFEAIALGRPLVVSDVAGLRRRFGPAALCCANQPAAMADTIRRALHEQTALAGRSRALQAGLHLQRERALAQLQAILQASDRPSPTAAGASSAP